MNLRSVFEALRRRWFVVVPILLITAGGVIWVSSESNAEYEATAILLLADPRVVGTDTGGLTDTETGAVDDGGAMLDTPVVIQVVEGDTTRSRLGLTADAVDYTVTEVGEGVLKVEATSPSQDSVVEAANTVIAEIDRVVQELDDADESRTADMRVLSEARVPRQRTILNEGGEGETEYYAAGSVQLDIAQDMSSLQSPYTASAGTLRVLEEAASASRVTESIREEVGDAQARFELVYQLRDAAPIVHVVATGSSPETTMDTLETVLGYLDADLAERQAVTGADESTWIEFQRLAMPEDAQTPEGRLRRPIVTIIALGVVAAASLAVLVDTLLSQRRQLSPTMENDRSETGEVAESAGRTRAS